MKARLLFIFILLSSLACAVPVLVPTAIPLPSPTPTWTLLPSVQTEAPATFTPPPPETSTPAPTETGSPTATQASFTCAGAPAPRLAVGDYARVTVTDGLPLRVRETPEVLPNNVKSQLSEGLVFLITGGPVCATIPNTENAFVFWEIEVEATGLTGWVAEGDETAYYIETIP